MGLLLPRFQFQGPLRVMQHRLERAALQIVGLESRQGAEREHAQSLPLE